MTAKRLGQVVTLEQAQEALDKGNQIVQGGGYTFVKDVHGVYYYCAFGTWPGCLRTCDVVILTDHKHIKEWRLLTTLDVVKSMGYFPDGIYHHLEHWLIRKDRLAGLATINLRDMLIYCIDSVYTSGDLKDPAKSSVIWTDYFNTIEENVE